VHYLRQLTQKTVAQTIAGLDNLEWVVAFILLWQPRNTGDTTMHYRSAITKLNLRPWKLFLLAIVVFIIEAVMSANGIDGAIIMVPFFIWIILLLDAIVSKIRDLIKR
jgi:hypothetical protein